MRGKAALLIALGAGYVLGTKAGWERYRQIVARARQAWSTDEVQGVVDTVTGAAAQVAGKAHPGLGDKAERAGDATAQAAHRSASKAQPDSATPPSLG